MPKPNKQTIPTASPSKHQEKQPNWPSISPKNDLDSESIMDGQIYIIDDIFTPAECKAYIALGGNINMDPPKPPGKDEARRTNFRYSTYSPTLTDLLYPVIIPNIPSAIPTPKSLFPRIKLYHYPPGTFFESHYDDSVKDPQTGLKSEWTVLIFLSGEEDGIEGGGTVFHLPRVGKKKEGEVLRVRAKRGRMVLHKHGRDCLLHEGELVRSGKIGKWVLRTDLMY